MAKRVIYRRQRQSGCGDELYITDNLFAHYDACGLTTNTTNFYGIVDASAPPNIDQLNDISGNGYNLTPIPGVRGQLLIADQNGKNAIDAREDRLDAANNTIFNLLHNGSDFTLYIACLVSEGDTTSRQEIIGSKYGFTPSEVGFNMIQGASDNVFFRISNGSADVILVGITSAQHDNTIPQIYTCRHENSAVGDDMQVFVNSTLVSGANASAAYSASNSNDPLHLSDGSGALDEGWVGKFYQMLIYSVAHSTAQRQEVETFLNNKWAIY